MHFQEIIKVPHIGPLTEVIPLKVVLYDQKIILFFFGFQNRVN